MEKSFNRKDVLFNGKRYPVNIYYNEDNIKIMNRYPDNFFDFAVVDPPYGIKEDGKSNHSRGKKEGAKRKAVAEARMYTPKDWDSKIPDPEYFYELRRVSRHQIIWGGNHFQDVRIKNPENPEEVVNALGKTTCWLIWDKDNGSTSFADFEMAWTSLPYANRIVKFMWSGMLQGNMKRKEDRIHPCQKPVWLYFFIVNKFIEKMKDKMKIIGRNVRVIDTHVGSASSLICFRESNIDFVGAEADEEYFEDSCKRLEHFKNGYFTKLNDSINVKEPTQVTLF